MSFGEVLTVVGLLLTLAGLVFAGWQFRQNARVERARFLVELANGLLADKEVEKLFYTILEGGFQFDEAKPPGQAQMRLLDALLAHFNLIGCLLQMQVISGQDVALFGGEAWAVLTKASVQAYINWVNADPNIPTPKGGWWPYLRYLQQHLPAAG